MKKRQIFIILAGLGILAVSILVSGMLTKDKAEEKKEVELRTAVRMKRMSPDTLIRTIPLTGRLIPEQSVMLYAEVGGKAMFGNRPFKEGVAFNEGDVLLSINSDELQSTLNARRSSFQSLVASVIPDLKLDFPEAADQWENYLYSINTDQRLKALPSVEDKKLKLFLSGRQVFSQYYGVQELETRLDKHLIRAPFNGSLTQVELDESALVRVGQPLGSFISKGRYELEAGVSYTDLEYLSLGTVFTMKDLNTGKTYRAKVVRINDSVDPQTQQVKVYAAINNPTAKSGIFLQGNLPAGEIPQAIEIPLEALVGEGKIYLVEDSTAILTKVEVAFKNGEKAIISGISNPVDVIIDKHNESLNGSKVAPVNLAE